MGLEQHFNLVVAGVGPDGKPAFLEPGAAVGMSQPGIVDVAFMWANESTPVVPKSIGGAPTRMGMPGPNGSAFGVVRFPANSAGKLDASDVLSETTEVEAGNEAMHATDTVDYEIILSGKIDIVLPGNQRRTLKPGDLLVMGGVPHAWENIYDEDCTYVFVVVGAERGK
jgi:hypothetical protein